MLNLVKMSVAAVAVGLVATACQPGVEYDTAQSGAAYGAAVGCVAKLALDPTDATNATDCVNGALVGGLTGAAVGAVIDESEQPAG